jgi:hypothetical protein
MPVWRTSGRTRRRFLGVTVLLAIAGWSAEAHAASFASTAWTVDLSTLSTKKEGGTPNEFDVAELQSVSAGAALGLSAFGGEEWEARDVQGGLFDIGDQVRTETKLFDAPVTYSLATTNTVDVRITCELGDGRYDASLSGTGNLETGFEDGFPFGRRGRLDRAFNSGANAFFGTNGTGFSKGAVGIRAIGDLDYDPGMNAGVGLGQAVGEEEGLSADVGLPGVTLSTQTRNGQGTENESLAKGATAKDVVKKTFAFTLQNQTSTAMKADDGFLGAAYPKVETSAAHTGTVTAVCADKEVRSRLDLRLVTETDAGVAPAVASRTVALADVTTVLIQTGEVVEYLQGVKLSHVPALFRRTPLQLLRDEGWDSMSRTWTSAPRPVASVRQAGAPAGLPGVRQSRRVGVKRGSLATYRLTSRRPPLDQVTSMSFKVANVDPATGDATLNGTVGLRDGQRGRRQLPVNVLTGEGELRAVLIPTGLRVGQKVHGIGRVVRRRRDDVIVRYVLDGGSVNAVYDRGSGWLRKMAAGNPRRPALSITRLEPRQPR